MLCTMIARFHSLSVYNIFIGLTLLMPFYNNKINKLIKTFLFARYLVKSCVMKPPPPYKFNKLILEGGRGEFII